MNDRPARKRPDEGFTLVEMLLVMVVLGIIMGALAMVVVVVLRTSPPTEVRADDARSLQGLVTWIPQDVDAAPPGGFNTDVNAWPCGGPAPGPDSYNLVAITWTEKTAVTINYAAAYRYDKINAEEWRISRYTCDDSSGSMSTPFRQNLTAQLPEWNAGSPPASVTMCSAPVDNNGDCPPGNVITTPTSPDVESIKLRVTRIDGVVSTIDAAPKNPDQDLADDPNATTNHPPTVSNTNYVLDMYAGDTTTIDLAATHGATDIDGHAMSVAIDSSEPFPANITASTADPLDLTVTADPALPTGTISPSITLIISDPFAGWISVTVTVNIVPEPNSPPTVSPANYHLLVAPGDDVVLPIDVTHGASDPNGDPLTVTVVSWPFKVHQPTPNNPRPLDLEIRTKSSAAPGPALTPIQLLIDDGNGGTVPATVTVEVVAPTPNNPPTATTTNVNVVMKAGETVTMFLDSSHGVSDADGHPLKISQLDAAPVGITTNFAGGLELDIIADPSLSVGVLSPAVGVEVEDIYGDDVHVTITVTIIPTPPPPSDCVLGTLTAVPSTVDRHGNGSGPRLLKEDVTVTVTYSGSCDGLVLNYDTGDTSGLGVGSGRVFPPGSPSSIVVYGKGNGGTEKWWPGTYTLTASTTSAVTPNQVTTTLTVT